MSIRGWVKGQKLSNVSGFWIECAFDIELLERLARLLIQ